MKPITNDRELDLLIASLTGPACFLVHNGDYDRGLALPNGKSFDYDFCRRTTAQILPDRETFRAKCTPGGDELYYVSGIARMADEGNLKAMEFMLVYADCMTKCGPKSYMALDLVHSMVNELIS